jgi:hypothetical protein
LATMWPQEWIPRSPEQQSAVVLMARRRTIRLLRLLLDGLRTPVVTEAFAFLTQPRIGVTTLPPVSWKAACNAVPGCASVAADSATSPSSTGYRQFNPAVTWVAVIAVVQVAQFLGNLLARKVLCR